MKYDLKKRIFLVKKFYKFDDIAQVQRAFRSQYKNDRAPSSSTIKNIVSNFEKTGSVGYVKPQRRERVEKREQAKNQLQDLFSGNPSLSTRKAAAAVCISKSRGIYPP